MRPGTRLGTGATVVALLALLAAWAGFRQTRADQRARAAIARDEAAIATARARERADASAGAPAGPPAAAPAPPSVRKVAGPSVASLLAADPKLMDLYLRSFRAGLPDRFGAIYARLGMSPAQIDRFEELSTAHEGEIMDLRAAAEAQGLPDDDPGIAAMRQQSNRDYRTAITTLALSLGLTPSRLEQENNLANGALESVLGGVASLAALSPAPMTYAQAGQLAPILAAANTAASPGAIDRSTIDWDKVLPQAAAILPAPQVQALQAQATAAQVLRLAREFDAREHPAAAP